MACVIFPVDMEFATGMPRVPNEEVAEVAAANADVLITLAQHAGRVLEHTWGEEYAGEGHLLRVNMSRLRSKLEPDPAHPRYLLTKAGIGYMLATTVAEP